MTITLEAGKQYRTRDGGTTGPLETWEYDGDTYLRDPKTKYVYACDADTGHLIFPGMDDPHKRDIVGPLFEQSHIPINAA